MTLPRAPAAATEPSDIELVDNVLRLAPGAVEAFYRRHSQLIYHCIRSRADRQDVDDIFQAFFERLMKRDYRVLRLWQRGTSLPVYLSKVVRNFVIDFHRARRLREQAVGGTAELEPFVGARARNHQRGEPSQGAAAHRHPRLGGPRAPGPPADLRQAAPRPRQRDHRPAPEGVVGNAQDRDVAGPGALPGPGAAARAGILSGGSVTPCRPDTSFRQMIRSGHERARAGRKRRTGSR